jgi:hypothetical protein
MRRYASTQHVRRQLNVIVVYYGFHTHDTLSIYTGNDNAFRRRAENSYYFSIELGYFSHSRLASQIANTVFVLYEHKPRKVKT